MEIEGRAVADQQRPAEGADARVECGFQRDLRPDAGGVADGDGELAQGYSSLLPPGCFGFSASGSSFTSFTRMACLTIAMTLGEGLTILPTMSCSSAPATGLMSMWVFFASARKAGSFIVSSKARRSAATRSC